MYITRKAPLSSHAMEICPVIVSDEFGRKDVFDNTISQSPANISKRVSEKS